MQKLIKPFLLSSCVWALSLGLPSAGLAQHSACQAQHLGSQGAKDFIAEFRPYLNRFEAEFRIYNTKFKTNDQLATTADVLEDAIGVYKRFHKTYCDWPKTAPKREIQDFVRMNAYVGVEAHNRLRDRYIPQDRISFWENLVSTYIGNFWVLKDIHEKYYPDIVESRDVQGLAKICPDPCDSYSSGMAKTPTPTATPYPSRTAASYITEGDDYYNKKMYYSAIGSYSKAIEISPEASTYFARGQAYYKLSLYDSAIDDFSDAVIASPVGDPNFYWYVWWKGDAYLGKGDYNKAKEEYTWVISRLENTDDKEYIPALYDNRAICYINMGKYSEALNDSNMAISLSPSVGLYYAHRASTYYNLSSYTQAETDANKAIELNPQLANPYNTLGNVYYSKGYYPLAIEKYTNAIKLDPASGVFYSNRGSAYTNIKQCSAANQDYRKACDLGYSSACSARCN